MNRRFLSTALGAMLLLVGISEVAQASNIKVSRQVIASGLDNPRHLTFGPDGLLYIAEAGRGGTVIQNLDAPELIQLVDGGFTSSITRLRNGTREVLVDGLPSFGSSGTNAERGFGVHDIGFDKQGNFYGLIGAGVNQEFRSQLGVIGDNLGYLMRFNLATGEQTKLFDFATYESTNNPDGEVLVTNGYDLEISDDRIAIADAGANTVFFLGTDGLTVERAYAIPRSLVGTTSIESVPTAIVQGPDGAYYVGQLTGEPFPEDAAKIYRFADANATPTVFAEGFTQIIDLDFDAQGNLYVLELAQLPLDEGDPTGALIQIAPDGTRRTLASDGLIYPTGVTIGPDNDIYIANRGFLGSGEGEIVRLQVSSVPEPSLVGSLFVFGVLSTCWKWSSRK